MMSRHPADLLSLIFGLLFVAVGLLLLSGDGAALSMAWLGPLIAVALGALLVQAARSGRVRPGEGSGEG